MTTSRSLGLWGFIEGLWEINEVKSNTNLFRCNGRLLVGVVVAIEHHQQTAAGRKGLGF
jgi:hypothetical protein|tara:strand:+ start:344 stop:520 length:177 start_codon:yes stop_codon:yes gene_type:complete